MRLITSIQEFIRGFRQRSGSAVLLSTLFSRGFSFLGSWTALQLIDDEELGVILFAFSIVQFLIPLAGLGLYQSLIRFGALMETEQEKRQLFNYVLKKGTISSLFMIGFILVIGSFIPFQFEDTYLYLGLLSVSILSFFFLEVVKVQFRLNHQNKLFALTDFYYSAILLVLIGLLSYFFKGNGYVIAIILSPMIAALLFVRKFNINLTSSAKPKVVNLKFWKYGFFGGLSNVATQLLLIIDLLLIGYLLESALEVTLYRYISIIPLSLLFLPRVFIATDFVSFTEKIWDKAYIAMYIKNYLLFFVAVSIFLSLIGILWAEEILSLFGTEYPPYSESFGILMTGITGIFILRGLFGNLLSSIGKIEWNYWITSFAIILNVMTNYMLIPKYGIKGAAITSATLMWVTGVLSVIAFIYWYKKTNLRNT